MRPTLVSKCVWLGFELQLECILCCHWCASRLSKTGPLPVWFWRTWLVCRAVLAAGQGVTVVCAVLRCTHTVLVVDAGCLFCRTWPVTPSSRSATGAGASLWCSRSRWVGGRWGCHIASSCHCPTQCTQPLMLPTAHSVVYLPRSDNSIPAFPSRMSSACITAEHVALLISYDLTRTRRTDVYHFAHKCRFQPSLHQSPVLLFSNSTMT
jgi:hypothetical protein